MTLCFPRPSLTFSQWVRYISDVCDELEKLRFPRPSQPSNDTKKEQPHKRACQRGGLLANARAVLEKLRFPRPSLTF